MNLKKLLNIGKTELLIAFLSFALIFIIVFSSRISRLSSEQSLVFEEETIFTFQDRTSLESLMDTLSVAQVHYHKEEMEWAARLLGWRLMRPGRYTFEGNYSYNAFLSKMARGIQDPVNLTILPGISQSRFADQVSSQLNFEAEDMREALSDSLFLARNNWVAEDLFGRMLPDTYLVYWTSSAAEIRDKVVREFKQRVRDTYEARMGELDLSVNEVLTLASIIEWEAYNDEEKPMISGLYWNRLNRGMYLQADPTVNYALGERRRLLFEDYRIDHPYNTYVNVGLPPGPITNPSLSSIEAALYPEDHEYLYMVASPEGGHVFSETFEQHKRESEKWRRWLREQYRIKRERESEAGTQNAPDATRP